MDSMGESTRSIQLLACALGLALAGPASLFAAGEASQEVRRLEPRRRPKIEFIAGGDPVFRLLPPDAIRAIDEPEMISAIDASEIMRDDEPVVGVFDGNSARAYPTWFLDAHEIVNDHLGDKPIAATWCPLANTGVVYVREVDGEETTFGVTGTLWRDSLVLFDRKTNSYWSQVTGKAIRGPQRDRILRELPSVTTTWGAWKRLHPETQVLRPDQRSRSGSPFAGYFEDPGRLGITRTIKPDRRLPGKSLVIGIHDDNAATAVPLDLLSVRAVVQGSVSNTPVAVVSVASHGGFGYDRRLSGWTLDFEAGTEGRLRDLQTGSTWDPESGTALEGPLAGQTLRRVDSRPAYWFIWATFHPATEILGQDRRQRQGKVARKPGSGFQGRQTSCLQQADHRFFDRRH